MKLTRRGKINVVVYTSIVILLALSYGVYYWRTDIQYSLKFGLQSWPSYAALDKCSWRKESFHKSGISFFLQICPGFESPITYSEDSQGKILRSSGQRSQFTMQTYAITDAQNPLAIVQDWYSKLTPVQKQMCEIKNADVPVEYLPDGTPINIDTPHPTPHKTRYEIAVKPEIVRAIVDKYGGLPDNKQYDFLCGDIVGTSFVTSNPYFEFDDRSPDKYLFVGSLGNDGSVLIDLDSIRF